MIRRAFNKDNWTGDYTAVCYSEKCLHFVVESLGGYDFCLVPIEGGAFKILGSQWPEDHILGFVFKWAADHTQWVGSNHDYTMTREDENMFVAAGKILCNII